MSVCVNVRLVCGVWLWISLTVRVPLSPLPPLPTHHPTPNHKHRIEPFKQQVVTYLAAWSGRQRRRLEAGGQGEDLGAFLNRLCVVLAALAVQVGDWIVFDFLAGVCLYVIHVCV